MQGIGEDMSDEKSYDAVQFEQLMHDFAQYAGSAFATTIWKKTSMCNHFFGPLFEVPA